MEENPLAEKKNVNDCLKMKDPRIIKAIEKKLLTKEIFVDETLCLIISNLMEEVPINSEHYF